MINDLHYEGIKFPVSKKEINKIEKKNNICNNTFCYENNMVYPVYVSNGKFENCIDLLMITDKYKSHYVCIKDLNTFMHSKTKNKNKKNFANTVYNVLVMRKFW